MKKRFELLSDSGERGLLVIDEQNEKYVFSHYDPYDPLRGLEAKIGKIEVEESPDKIILLFAKRKMVLRRRWKEFWTLSEVGSDNVQIFKELRNLMVEKRGDRNGKRR